ncbi:MAG: type II toxin-antitoxin system VapC family toxin [Dehalococcoidia bacterium]
MPGKVVDASVLGALIFNEPRAAEAASLLNDSDLYAPTLLAYELASVARKKILLYPEQREALLQALEIALALDITWVEVDHPAVARLALETNLTTYDASYLYLSRHLNFPLATFDERLGAAT